MDKAKIKAFVQQTLGCGCPEEVFRHIECESDISRDGVRILYRINIGNRLLVYVLPVDGLDALGDLIPVIVNYGLRDRDSSGFNRLRLVLAAEDEEYIRSGAEDIFKNMQQDEKVHLHVIPKISIPKF